MISNQIKTNIESDRWEVALVRCSTIRNRHVKGACSRVRARKGEARLRTAWMKSCERSDYGTLDVKAASMISTRMDFGTEEMLSRVRCRAANPSC